MPSDGLVESLIQLTPLELRFVFKHHAPADTHVGLDFGLFMFVRFMYYVTCAWKINTLMCSILMSEDIEDG